MDVQARLGEIAAEALSAQALAGLPPPAPLPEEDARALHELCRGGVSLCRAWGAERLAEEVVRVELWALHVQGHINREGASLHWLERALDARLGKALGGQNLGGMWQERRLRALASSPEALGMASELARRRARLESVLWVPVRLEGLSRAMRALLEVRNRGAKG